MFASATFTFVKDCSLFLVTKKIIVPIKIRKIIKIKNFFKTIPPFIHSYYIHY